VLLSDGGLELSGEVVPDALRAVLADRDPEGDEQLGAHRCGPSAHPPIITEGDLAAYRWIMTGTNLRPFYGRTATGNAVTLPGADFIEVACGLLRRVVEYSDTAGFTEQLEGSR
jgi:hypothetical protein